MNGEGALSVRIDRTGGETYLAQVIRLVEQAQATRSRTQDLANRAAAILTWVAIGVGGGTFLIWLLLDATLAFALERMVTVMVISCPHALGLAVPLVVAVSTELTARNGLLIRDRAAFERVQKDRLDGLHRACNGNELLEKSGLHGADGDLARLHANAAGAERTAPERHYHQRQTTRTTQGDHAFPAGGSRVEGTVHQ